MFKFNHLLIFVIIVSVFSCKKEIEPDPIIQPQPTESPNAEVANLWGQMTLSTITKLPLATPTYCSRALGYLGLTMYETVVGGSTNQISVASQLPTLPALPRQIRATKYNYLLALNAGQAYMLKNLFEFAPPERLIKIDSLEKAILEKNKIGVPTEEVDRSIIFGKTMAEAIFEWSKSDGGYQAFKQNFVPTYSFPMGPLYWVPPVNGQVISMFPLHPFWGKNRTFSPENSKIPVPTMVTFSRVMDSEYFKMMEEVYQKNIRLTVEEKEIAAWWGDDPTEAFTPPGHSYSLAYQVITKEKLDLFSAAETYARVGMAVADAFVNCWKAKYKYHCERPSTYIRANINPSFVQYWPEPPFPAFYSGHSVQGAASATVLEALFGKNYAFTDNSHLGREKDVFRNVDFKPRKFNSFWEAAEESALSRFYGGIHTKADNETGLTEGKKIGENINKLKWRN